MTVQVFIDGAVGTTGLEIAQRLAGREEFALITLDEARRKDDAARREAINDADVVILCLPDDAAVAAVGMIANARTRVIDASTAHRVAPGWTYGFPEVVGREAVAAAKRVANPGCYPTGFIALLAPLIRANLLPVAWPYSCHAVSGYSGGGKALIERFEADRDIAWRGYGLAFGHKHVPEMQAYAHLAIAPLFSPAVIAAMRGMVVEVPLPLSIIPGAPSADVLRAALTEFYAGSPIVSVAQDFPAGGELLLRASMAPWDGLELHVIGSADGEQARLVARLDNLGKGASGAAVQSLNLMAGLDETAGLRL
ncbi:N-acetyl-gamma-glutamyl-phosphate reductase [Novosphingobium sp. FKTRR1]|uniref:N-acetyl-gamma-glutamyl-phosphate reductase n=1 Tax=Novosphingobium sp. FKTRR1 TaxID=2879118 RepID=UPI001CF09BF8|nr:N-acetyl-gamma-glutamyl-phosphate reductase [Novosphingobium sp. FKTRR1]